MNDDTVPVPTNPHVVAEAAAPLPVLDPMDACLPPAGSALTRHQREMLKKAEKAKEMAAKAAAKAAATQAKLDAAMLAGPDEDEERVALPQIDRATATPLQRAVLAKIDEHRSIRKLGEACGVDYTYLWRLAKGVYTNPSNEVLAKLDLMNMSQDSQISAMRNRIDYLEQKLMANGISPE